MKRLGSIVGHCQQLRLRFSVLPDPLQDEEIRVTRLDADPSNRVLLSHRPAFERRSCCHSAKNGIHKPRTTAMSPPTGEISGFADRGVCRDSVQEDELVDTDSQRPEKRPIDLLQAA